MKTYLSKSRYTNAVQCPKMLWLRIHKPELFDDSVMNEAVLQTGSEVGDLAMGLFGDYTEVPYGDLKEMIRITSELMETDTDHIAEASFSYEGCFCSVDILRNKHNGHVNIYEVKSSTSMHDIYEDDAAYQYYVLNGLGYTVDEVYLVHLNNSYERIGELDLQQLFVQENITGTVKEMQEGVREYLQYLDDYLLQKKEPELPVSENCHAPYDCGFFAHCTEPLGHPNVFDLQGVTFRTKLKYYSAGITSYADLEEDGTLSQKAMTQIRHALHDLPDQIDREAVHAHLLEYTYPLYFLDFETFQPAIPLYDHSFPYEQIVFQYSLHYYEEKGGKLKHKEFLAEADGDPRRAAAEHLCADIPEDVCIVTYNMSFEKGRIKRLAELFPDLHDHLMNIYDHIIDQMIPFRNMSVYTSAMQGSYSIKYVLPALFPNDPELDYHSLEGVHNGAEASSTFMRMQGMSRQEQQEYRRQLLSYCYLDTYAMVKIYDYLQKL